MRRLIIAALPMVLSITPALAAKAIKVIEPLPADVVGHVAVTGTTIVIGDTARTNVDKLDAKAAVKQTEIAAGPTSATISPPPPSGSPDTTDAHSYSGLALTAMLPLEVASATRDWGLVSGRRVRLSITIDTLKTANMGLTLVLGSSDELAGIVDVLDADSGTRLGEFYIDVVNFHAGMLGAALRGSGVREKLAAEFAKHVAEQLSGSKHKLKAKTT